MKIFYSRLSNIQKRIFWVLFCSLFVFGATQIKMSQVYGLLQALGLRIETTASIITLENYNGYSSTVYVTDSLRGGTFTYVSTGLVPDSGTVFPANGKGGGYWQRSIRGDGSWSPLWFGAKRDGITDDGHAFQLMNDAIAANGNKVTLGYGTYLINTPVTITKSLLFEGNNMTADRDSVTLIRTTSNIVVFNIVQNGVKFKNLKVTSAASGTSGNIAFKVDSNYTTHSFISGFSLENVVVTNFYIQAQITGAMFCNFTNCYFLFTNYYAIDIGNRFNLDAGDSYITGCTFLPHTNSALAAIHQTSSGGLRITNCKFNWRSTGTGWFQYDYLADSIHGTSDLFLANSSVENWKTSAIKIKKSSAGNFSLVTITGNEFGDFQSSSRPAITIDSITGISMTGNTFAKGSVDTAIVLTSVTSTNLMGNSYSSGYGTTVSYLGTNTNTYGEGVALGTKNRLPKFIDLLHIGNSIYEDSLGIPSIYTPNIVGGHVLNYMNDGATGFGKLSIVNNAGNGTIDVGFINSNIAGVGAFTFWKQTGATTSVNVLSIKANANVGFGSITSPIAYVDVAAGTGATSTGQIHLYKGVKTNADGYLSYDTTLTGTPHLVFNKNGTNIFLDSTGSGSSGTAILANGTVPLTADWNVNNHAITGITSLSANSIGASSITSNNTISANGTVSGSNFSATTYNFGTGTTTGLLLRNGQPATSTATVQNSLMQLWTANVWDGSVSHTVNYRAGVYPIGGTATSEWKLSTFLDAVAAADIFKVKNDGRVTLYNVINQKGYTVATLPAGTVGDMAYVTDASSPSYLATVVGGGSTYCPVTYNGSAWICH